MKVFWLALREPSSTRKGPEVAFCLRLDDRFAAKLEPELLGRAARLVGADIVEKMSESAPPVALKERERSEK